MAAMIRLVQVAKRARSAIMPVAGTVVEVATALRFASAVRDMKHMQVALPPPLSLGVLGLAADVPSMERRDDDLEAVQEGEDDEETTRLGTPKETWKESTWFAVPKRKQSYRKKRSRQMNPLYKNVDAENFYPCPKCDKGFLKLRHHLCPCDQEAINAKAVVKVPYSSTVRANVGKEEAEAAAAAGEHK